MPEQPGFLTRKKIEPLIAEGLITAKTYSVECLGPWFYDLRLGTEAYISSEKTLRVLREGDSIVIQPGEFALLMTWEEVNIPLSHVAFISLKLSHALRGLVNVSGFHVDPGFKGHIVFSVYNAGPRSVVMRCGDKVFMIILADLSGLADERPVASTFQGLTQLKSEWIASIQGPPVSLAGLNRMFEKLSWKVNFLISLLSALIVALAASLLTLRIR